MGMMNSNFIKFKRFVKEPDQAVQFLSTVSTESSLNNRPKNSPTTDEILNYTLQEEIMNTSKRGSYSGKFIYINVSINVCIIIVFITCI